MDDQNLDDDVLSETENYVIFRSFDALEGYFYHVALGGVTLNLTAEEWNELVLLIKSADV